MSNLKRDIKGVLDELAIDWQHHFHGKEGSDKAVIAIINLIESVIPEEQDYPVNTEDKNLNMANANKILLLRDIKSKLIGKE